MLTLFISYLPVLSSVTKSMYFISAHRYLHVCRMTIQDSSKQCFLFHSLCMEGIKTPNSSQLHQLLGFHFLLWAKAIQLLAVDLS